MKFNIKAFKHFKSLMMKSAVVQLEIEDETSKKSPNWVRIVMLKKQRLAIKDKLAKLSRRTREIRAHELANQH